MDDSVDLEDPVAGNNICTNSEGMWPTLETSGHWNAMVDPNVRDGNFKYTADFRNHECLATCTETGCTFSEGC
jgi:hypothetical protein